MSQPMSTSQPFLIIPGGGDARRDPAPVSRSRDRSRLVIPGTCTLCGGPRGYANIAVSKRGGVIEFDAHVAGACVLSVEAPAVYDLHDALTRWLG